MIKGILKRISNLDIHTYEVITKSASSTLVKIGGMIFGLLVSILLGRTLGADGIGIINLSSQLTSLILIICILGMRQVIVKEVAIGFNRKDWEHIGNVMYSSYLLNGIVTISISVILILLTPWISNNIFHEPRLIIPLTIAFVVLVPRVFSRLFASGLIGFKKIWQSNLADQTLSLIVIAFILSFLWIIDYQINVVVVAIVYAIGRFIVTITLGIYWGTLFKSKTKKKNISRKLIKTALPLLLMSSAAIIASNASTIMLGWLGDIKQVGLYTVSSRIALLTSFFLQVTNASISPKIAALYADNKMVEMEKMVQQVTKGLGIIGLAPLLVFVFFGKFILTLWGADFVNAYWILIILSIGQFFNISTGATGLILIMCGQEKIQGKLSLIFLVVNLILNYFLILNFGAVGAGIATAITIAGINISKLIYVKIKFGILTIPKFIIIK